MQQTITPSVVRLDVSRSKLIAKFLSLAVVLAVAFSFVVKYVFHYYLHYDPQAFGYHWPHRAWLLLHMSGGTLALLAGPWQFWSGLRQRHLRVHRWTGRLFLLGVLTGASAAIYLALHTPVGWAWGVVLFSLAIAWLTTAGMAYAAIRKGLVQIHKEWMVRAYVVTFAFVTFRVLNEYAPTSRLQPEGDRLVTLGWLCWVVPLLITEVVLELRRMRGTTHGS